MNQHARLFQIRLEPAPGPHEASGAATYGFVAPLDERGMIDPEAWKQDRGRCFVHRVEEGETVRHGLLAHRPGGPNGASWVFDYELGSGDEETGFRFDAHAFTPGGYVSIREADGELHTYRIASVKPA